MSGKIEKEQEREQKRKLEEKLEKSLLEALHVYAESDFYPLHMPGHKRQIFEMPMKQFKNPFGIDITEIEGFDNLHHAEGILKSCMEHAAKVYGTEKTYFLVNGSSCGILAAVSACTAPGQSFLMARNCHKSVYHGVFLRNLKAEYIYPQIFEKLWIQGGILADSVDNCLTQMEERGNCPSAVLIVSPTYDGLVSDVRGIAEAVHRHGSILIVDEAHGAHFPFSFAFPESAISMGADVVIQSLHKTLPSMTQTAVLHVCSDRVDLGMLEYFLQIYQSSSPSYVFMAAMDTCIRYMERSGEKKLEELRKNLDWFYERVQHLRKIQVIRGQRELVEKCGIVDVDCSKILIYMGKTGKNGAWLADRMREEYHMELEMVQEQYGLALMSLMDTKRGFERLAAALCELDAEILKEEKEEKQGSDVGLRKQYEENGCKGEEWYPEEKVTAGTEIATAEIVCTIQEAVYSKKRCILWKDALGEISGEFVYVYPPGIPILAPGERISENILNQVRKAALAGLPLQGMRDREGRQIEVIDR
ncbi:MAG: aminotransferase class I/II-fold pyridoxal phosphate-dependent enzyme [bacterium]|nr:aminotransferase class I/II-fold pyridoxal phosphate-dependent enzyme [bacterium]